MIGSLCLLLVVLHKHNLLNESNPPSSITLNQNSSQSYILMTVSPNSAREEFFCVKLRNSLPAYQRIEEQASSSPKSIGSFFQGRRFTTTNSKTKSFIWSQSRRTTHVLGPEYILYVGHLIFKRGERHNRQKILSLSNLSKALLIEHRISIHNKSYHICTAVNYFLTWMQNNKKGRTTLTNTVERWNAEKRNEKEKEILLIYWIVIL